MVVSECLRIQSQPFSILTASKEGFSVKLRKNLNQVQCSRLIVGPISQSLLGYSVTPDWDALTLNLTRRTPVANKVGGTKPTRNGKGKPAPGAVGISGDI